MYARQNNIKINYPIEIDGVRVPSDQWVAGQTQAWRDANNITIHDDPIEPPYDSATQKRAPRDDGEYVIEELPLTQAIANKRNEINAAYEQSMQLVTAGYPQSEIQSWDKQETEARAWAADNSALTPFIDALAAARGIAKAELVTRIITKADAATGAVAGLTGTRQALEDAINVVEQNPAATNADLRAIVWPA